MKFGNVLVTGGAGFLGSQLVKHLLPISEHITIIDNLRTGLRSNIPQSDKITFYEESITNEELLEQVLPEVEWVFHLACLNLLLSSQNLREDFNANLYGGFILLEKAKTHCPKLKRFVYTSTASVYGNAAIIPSPESYHRVSMPYSASKFSMEHFCQVYYHMYRLPIVTLRLSNVYGPGQNLSNPYCGVVTKFFDAVEHQKPIYIHGDGKQTRDFTFIEDVMDAIILAGEHPEVDGKVYNVGTGKETSINQLAETIIKITDADKAHRIEYTPRYAFDKVERRAVDPSLIQRELQWSPRYSLEDGLAETFEWIKRGQV